MPAYMPVYSERSDEAVVAVEFFVYFAIAETSPWSVLTSNMMLRSGPLVT